jgi:hypothetical protein
MLLISMDACPLRSTIFPRKVAVAGQGNLIDAAPTTLMSLRLYRDCVQAFVKHLTHDDHFIAGAAAWAATETG